MCGRRADRGQAFPIYITVVAGLLFLAFVYFAVGQAAATRNGAQTAADAAALAAAQDARDQLRDGWLDVITDPTQWGEFINGERYLVDSACRRAASFAAKNDATLSGRGCTRVPLGEEGFHVEVRTLQPVGTSLVPVTERQHARATATAVIEPRCTFEAPEPTPEPPPEPPPGPEPTPDPTPTDPGPILGLRCAGESWEIDPERPRLPSAVDLFTVRLAD
ncbi:pilus assembly protein TadG-related protein [Streptomyces sp. NPDC015346]|uniref:pilus assembly protein TadG-related protein n=1 Tax=Streptomyces sp. NPDC015346 TaxID=3364954 RepID=UPI003702F71C